MVVPAVQVSESPLSTRNPRHGSLVQMVDGGLSVRVAVGEAPLTVKRGHRAVSATVAVAIGDLSRLK